MKDTFVPVESSRRYLPVFGGPAELVALDGGQHGFAAHDDPRYADPQTQAWQAEVIERVTGFLPGPWTRTRRGRGAPEGERPRGRAVRPRGG
ncbi:hypothetical protein [Streptomyces sp. BF23-19]|uniref:hypothetical protein n=1 Tax=unclassified Streptomyces TaxID=2593676 RepID=UPI0034E61477